MSKAAQSTGNLDRLQGFAGEEAIWGPQGLQLYCGSTELSFNCHMPLCLTGGEVCLTALLTCDGGPEELADGTLGCPGSGEIVTPNEVTGVGEGSTIVGFEGDCCSDNLGFEYVFPAPVGGGFDAIHYGIGGGEGGIGVVHEGGPFECAFFYPPGTVLPEGVSWPTREGAFTPGSGVSWSAAGGTAADFTCTWAPVPIATHGPGILRLTCPGAI